MRISLMITSRRQRVAFEVASCVESVTWETNRTGTPGVLKFCAVQSGGLDFLEGDTVTLRQDGKLQFFGWVFTKRRDRWGVIDVTCYDRLRYFKATAFYNFAAETAGSIIRQIAGDLEITVGEIADTGYPIPSLVEEEQSCLDIVGEAIQQTLLNTGKIFIFYDNGEGVCLKEAKDMKSDVMLGQASNLLDYAYTTDIDKQTYNYVKIARLNEKTGIYEVHAAEDSKTIARWGRLQLFQTVDGDVNDAQMKAQAEATLRYCDRRFQTLQVSALGVPGLRAGQLVWLRVPELGDINLDQYVLLDKVTHTWESGVHTMEFEALIGWEGI